MMALNRASGDFGLSARRVDAISAAKMIAANTHSPAMMDELIGVSPAAAGEAPTDAAGSAIRGSAMERAATTQPRIDTGEFLDRIGRATIHWWPAKTGRSAAWAEPSSVAGMPAVTEARKRIIAGSGGSSSRWPPAVL